MAVLAVVVPGIFEFLLVPPRLLIIPFPYFQLCEIYAPPQRLNFSRGPFHTGFGALQVPAGDVALAPCSLVVSLPIGSGRLNEGHREDKGKAKPAAHSKAVRMDRCGPHGDLLLHWPVACELARKHVKLEG